MTGQPIVAGTKLRDAVASLMRVTFGQETGALKDWPNIVDPDTAHAVPLVADAVIQLVLANYRLSHQLADYIELLAKGD